ncbi:MULTISPECIES: hypothetical protein [Burkholderiaceae]|uniref:hypothetical protein n=2 Tax=Burkholderiales TaxID=80840 RepID=UPI0009643A2D|nr:hypothetical protein [Burkholderia sp. b14]SIT67311.1 hypothetical protein SAMN04487769_1062 [Burkholderia sp. b14]
MDKVKNLQEKARALHELLARYAKVDDDAEMVLRFMSGLFEEIEQGKVVPPVEDKYQWYFADTDGPLFKYADLLHVFAQYSHALEDW